MSSSSFTQSARFAALGVISGSALALPLSAVDAGPIAIHGSVSATSAYSDRYNYLGDTKDGLDLNVLELTLNGAHRFESGLRAAAQLYAYEISGYNDLTLEFATLDYSFSEAVGVRVGRNKIAFGLYGESQDLDMIRPFAFLPLDFYNKTMRPLSAAYDGAGIYGTLSLAAAGTLDYQLNYGWIPAPNTAAPYVTDASESGPARNTGLDTDTILNVSIFWNAPVDGLRMGYTYVGINNIKTTGVMKTSAELAVAPNDVRGLPYLLPTGLWDMMVAGQPSRSELDAPRQTVSAEYTRGNWQVAAEYLWSEYKGVAFNPAPLGKAPVASKSDSYYGMVTWQALKKLQLGAYYAESYANRDDRDGNTIRLVQRHTAYLKDATLAASYGLTDWWLVKLEVHALSGTKTVTARDNGNAANWKKNWNYVVLKSTVSF